MNSLILASLATFFGNFGECFKKSWIYSVINKIYTAFSKSWGKSLIMNAVGTEKRSGEGVKSITGRILRFPFSILDGIKKKFGGCLRKAVDDSVICRYGAAYVQNFMAVNTRFFGVMLLSTSVSYMIIHYLQAGRISKLVLIAAIIGAILVLMNYNVMLFLNPSKLAGFVKSAAGFRQLSFDFFDESAAKGVSRLIIALITGLLTGAVMNISLLYGAAVPFAIFGALIVINYPVVGVFAAVFLAPIVPTMILAAVCIWTGFSLIIKSLIDDDFRWRYEGLGMVILAFLAVLFISSLLSFAPKNSLMVWAMYVVFAGFYFVLVNTIKTKKQLYGLLKVFVISGALVALYGVMQYAFGWTTSNAWIDETMFENDTMRVYSTLANPNVLGEYLLLVLPVAAVFMIKDKCRYISKWAYIAIFGLLGVCLILTQSRGCWIGFMLTLVIFITFYEGKWWGLLPLIILILPMIIPDTIIERISSVGNMEDSSTSYRVYIWMGTLGMLKHYLMGGIGMGEAAFNNVYPFFMYNAVIAPHSHNTFLQMIVESGISGLCIFLLIQLVFMVKMHSLHKLDDKKNIDSVVALALGSGVIGFLVQSLFDYTFYNYRVMAIFFMVMAMGISLKYIKSGEGDMA